MHARILSAGNALTAADGTELRTPAVVRLKGGQPHVLVVELEGHEPRQFRADARKVDQVDLLLTRSVAASIRFPHAPQTALAAVSGHVGIGLRGGRFGLARTGDSTASQVVDLGDLRSLDGQPVASSETIWYLTDDGVVHGLGFPAEGATNPVKYSFALGNSAASGLATAGGRLFVVDGSYRLACHDARTGKRLWLLPLDAEPSGAPVSDGKRVWVGTQDGRVRCMEALDGSLVSSWRDAAAPTTSTRLTEGRVVFACSDGTVRALAADGRQAWNKPVGRNLSEGELVVLPGAVVVRVSSRELLALDPANGELLASATSDGDIAGPMVAVGNKVGLVVRAPEENGRRVVDTLRTLDARSLVEQWEARLPAPVSGPVSEALGNLHVPLVDGQLLVFRD